MTKDELLTAVEQALRGCAGFDGSTETKDRQIALDYYFQRPRGDEVPGRSQLVSGDVSAMVEANLAQMLEAFTSERIVEFDPLGLDDEDQAQLEADAVQYFVMSKGNGFLQLAQAIKDALLIRNGVMKEWVEEKTQTELKTYVNVVPEAYGELAETGTVVKWDPDAGELKLRLKRTSKQFKSEAVPLENFVLADGWDSQDLQSIPICGERHVDTRSYLIGTMGFAKSKVEKLTAYRSHYKADSAARDPGHWTLEHKAVDESQELVEWYELYVLLDADNDGIAERHRVCAGFAGGKTLLEDVEVNRVPYASGVVIINPHRWRGISLFDKLRQVQDEHTALKRMRADSANTAVKNRTAYLDGKVNVDDLNSGRPNGDIRVKSGSGITDVRQAIMPFTVPDITPGINDYIERVKGERAEMGGAALQLATGEMQLNERLGSQGLDRAYSVMEQLAALYAKMVAATLIRSTFLLAHATLRENFDEPVPIKRNGKWISAVPSQWPVRECATVRVGMSPGERARKAATLDSMLQKQIGLAEAGMDEVLVNVEGFYRTLMDWARVSDCQNPEQYWIDPASDAAKKAMQRKQAQAKQLEDQQRALMDQAIQLEQMRATLDKYKADQETQFKYWKGVLDAEVAEAKIAGGATVELIKAKADGQANTSESAPEKPAPA